MKSQACIKKASQPRQPKFALGTGSLALAPWRVHSHFAVQPDYIMPIDTEIRPD